MNTRHFKRGKKAGEKGSALVELALSMPLLALILLGAAELARIAYAAIEVSNAAHAGAMYAASTGAVSDTGGITNAADADAANLLGTNAVSVTSVTTSCTCANTAYTPSSCSDNSTCQTGNTSMVTAVTVNTQSTYSPLIRIPGWTASTFTLTGTSTQVVSNQ